MRKIISFLQTNSKNKKSQYHIGECEEFITKEKFYTSTDALVNSKKRIDAEFILIGKEKDFNNISKLVENPPKFTKITYTQNAYEKLFNDIAKAINHNELDNKSYQNDYEVIIDITHSSRDNAFIAALNMLLNKLKPELKYKITIIQARYIEDKKEEYEFVKLDRYIKIMQSSFALLSFKQYIKVPNLSIDDDFYKNLKRFSEAFLSNQIDKCQDDYTELKNSLKKEKNGELAYLSEFIDDILGDLSFFDEITNQTPRYQIYFNVAVFLHKKGYFLNSSQFLIEAIPFYIYDCLKEFIKYKNNKKINKDISKLCKNFLFGKIYRDKQLSCYFNFGGNDEFIYNIYFDKFNILNNLRKNIGGIRHKLTHIEENSDVSQDDLKKQIDEFREQIIDNDILRDLSTKECNIQNYTAYKLKEFIEKTNKKMNSQIQEKNFYDIYIKTYIENDLAKNKEIFEFFDKNKKEVQTLYNNIKKEKITQIYDENLQ
ncbi:hypothetical protein [Campylobacter geochelonis]|uniref:Uncharacterized protein n=1 Tax=Campylobacter geochelonis TaxID=1780362 RepID=A0A128ED15_9BACT|nr:hypothetical protein [Campylobacter geochelonis]QKF70397.1 CRISPR/Cas system-associated DxTHG motif protein [Campylobacter geochelonis]CZE46371.1 Uncharacterised protein [Campylobacter geochelonis]